MSAAWAPHAWARGAHPGGGLCYRPGGSPPCCGEWPDGLGQACGGRCEATAVAAYSPRGVCSGVCSGERPGERALVGVEAGCRCARVLEGVEPGSTDERCITPWMPCSASSGTHGGAGAIGTGAMAEAARGTGAATTDGVVGGATTA